MKNYTLSTSFLIRTPLLALNGYMQKVLNNDTFESLKEVYRDMLLQEALFLSSPVLYEELLKWQHNSTALSKEEEERLAMSLWRYLSRMSSRCTPFGLFAGISMGEWKDKNDIILGDFKYNKRHTRPDMAYLGALAQSFSENEQIKPEVLFYPNNSLYNHAASLRFVDYYYEEKQRLHRIASIDNSDYVEMVLEKAKKGAKIDELLNVIKNYDPTIEEAEINHFIQEMIDSHILISELDSNTTGEEMLYRLIKTLKRIGYNKAAQLEDISIELKWLDNQHLGISPEYYKKIVRKLEAFNVPFELNRLFQTDMVKQSLNCILDKKIAGSLRRGLSILNRLMMKFPESNLQKFAQSFSERYEEKQMPLLEVLDIETGIGYLQTENTEGDINPMLDGFAIRKGSNAITNKINWNKFQSLLLKKLLDAQRNNEYETKIEIKELEKFEENWEDIPYSIAVIGKIIEYNEDKMPTILLEHVGGSATYLLGRFSCVSNDIHTWLCEIAEIEQKNADAQNSIIAEIVHLPESRTGNILMRSNFRAYEIPYLAQSTVEPDFQVQLNDLYVSVQGNEVILYSKKLKKRIIPSLGNAHSYSHNSLPVYHFLCDLQQQNQRAGMTFSWGNLSQHFTFLPRVKYENLILHRATWNLKKNDIEPIIKANLSVLMDEIKIFQKKYNIPNKIVFIDNEHELFIDLRHEFSVKTFIKEIKNKFNIKISEFLFDENNAIVKDENGGVYTNEFIAVFLKNTFQNTSSVSIDNQKETNLTRSFSLGSEWIYFKIYCGVATADDILTQYIGELASQFIDKGWIDQWFFIRYADPKNHLRVRFHLKNQKYLGDLIQSVYDTLEVPLNQKLVWKLQTDTYEREIERYTSEVMELSEYLFFIDSTNTIDFLKNLDDFNSDFRWLFSVFAIDNLFNVFNYSLERKTELMEKMKTNFGKEFGMNKYLRKQLNEKYEKYRKSITLEKSDDENIQDLKNMVCSKNNELSVVAAKIIEKCNYSQSKIDMLLESYIHMMLNRLFKSQQRMYEMLVYDFIYKTYKTSKYTNI